MVKLLGIYILSPAEMDIIKRDKDRLKRIQTLSEIDWEDAGNEADPEADL